MSTPSKYKEQIYTLLQQGKSSAEISEITGASLHTVRDYKAEFLQGKHWQEKGQMHMPPGFWNDWTRAVNRIRRYMGKEPSLCRNRRWSMKKPKKAKYETCAYAESVGRFKVNVSPECPKRVNMMGTLVSSKTRCQECQDWKARDHQ